MPALRGPDGKIVYVRDDEVPRYTAGGDYQIVSPETAGAAQSTVAPEDTGTAGAVRAGLGSLLSGATLGLSDVALAGMGTEGETEQLAAERKAHPVLSGLGQAAGMVLPALISGGAATPAGYLSRLAGQGIEAGAVTGGALGAAQSLTAAAAEGAVQNAGIYLSDVALGDRDLTAEGMTGALGTGLAFGAGGAVVAHGIEAGTIAARRMFARYAEGGEKAAQSAAHEWEQTSKASLDAFDQTADMARAKLAEAEHARAQAGLARDQAAAGLAEAKAWTPSTEPVAGPPPANALSDEQAAKLFGGEGVEFASGVEPPVPAQAPTGAPATAVLHAPVAAPAETAQLAAHLQEYTAARREFDEMRARVDPDLETAMQGLGSWFEDFDIQSPPVPVGEFGAPGVGGFKSQNELARLAAGTDAPGVAPALEAPGTRVLRGGARGTPEAKSLGEIAAESAYAPPVTADAPDLGKKPITIRSGDLKGEVERLGQQYATSRQEIDKAIDASDLNTLQRNELKSSLRDRVVYESSRSKPPATPLSDDEFSGFAEDKQSGLTDKQKQTSLAYSRQGLYAQINSPLREVHGKPGGGGLNTLETNLHGLVTTLDDAIASSPAPRDMVVSRGVSGQRSTAAMDKLQPGDVYVDPSFVSTSYSDEIGKDYTKGFGVRRGVEIKITVPEGHPALPIPSDFPKEREILLPRGGRYVVTGREVAEDGHTILHMTARAPDSFGGPRPPDGFSVNATDSEGHRLFNDNPDIGYGVPQYKDIQNFNQAKSIAYIVKPSELAGVDVTAATKQIADKWNGSLDLPAIEVDMLRGEAVKGPDGGYVYTTRGYHVRDGTKRLLAAAADGDRPVLVRFVPRGGTPESVPIADEIRSALPHSREAPAITSTTAPSDTLTGQLRGTLGALAGGESLPAMGAPARAEYAAAKAERTAQAAEHFRAKAIDAHDVPEYAAIKAHETKADSYLEQTLPARKIADRGYYEPPGGGTDAVRVENARKAIADGQREPVKLNVTPEGKITVTDGRHRLAAAIEADKPIKVKWSTGLEPAESDVLRAGRASADKTTSFNSSELGLHFDPKTRTYHPSSGVLKSGAGSDAPWNQGFGAHGTWETSGMAADERAAQAAAREHPLAVKQLEMAHDAALERAATAIDPAVKHEAIVEAQAIEKQLTSVGARPGAVEDVAAMAKVTTRVEKAAADLVEAMGPAAPPAAQQAAQAYRAAEEAADRKMAARIGRAAEDHAAAAAATEPMSAPVKSTKPGKPAPVKQPTTRDTRVAAAKQEKLAADAAHARAKAIETEARIGAKSATTAAADARAAAEASKPSAAPAQAPGRGSKLLDGAKAVGVAMELGSDFGIPGIPRPRDIPVIGPVLSAYLKYRALRAAAGRFVGRVPATAEAKAAALAAKTKDAVARAVDRSLGLIERNTPTTRVAITAAALKVNDALSRRAIDDGGPDAPKDSSPSDLAAVRMREVAAAVANPQLVIDHVRKQTRALTDPDLIQALENHLTAMFAHLNDTAPKGPPPNPYSKTEWKPSPAVALQWGRRYAVAQNPAVAFEALQAGTLTPDAAETLRVCYAKLFAMAQQRLAERAADIEHPVEYHQLVRNSLLFDQPLHASLEPENAAVLRTAYAPSAPAPGPGGTPPGGPPPPSIANGTNLTALYQTFSDRRALAR